VAFRVCLGLARAVISLEQTKVCTLRPYSCEKILDFDTVAFSFICRKYCLIIN